MSNTDNDGIGIDEKVKMGEKITINHVTGAQAEAAVRARMTATCGLRQTMYVCQICGTPLSDETGTVGSLAEHPVQGCCQRTEDQGGKREKVFIDSLVFGADGKVIASQRA